MSFGSILWVRNVVISCSQRLHRVGAMIIRILVIRAQARRAEGAHLRFPCLRLPGLVPELFP